MLPRDAKQFLASELADLPHELPCIMIDEQCTGDADLRFQCPGAKNFRQLASTGRCSKRCVGS